MKTHAKVKVSRNPNGTGGEAVMSPSAQCRWRLGRDGFTLVELVVVSAILGVLVLLVVPSYNHFVEGVKLSRCSAEIRGLEKDIYAYSLDRNVLPASLGDVGRGGLLDPWGNAYQYVNIEKGGMPRKGLFGADLNEDFDLYSVGKDGLSDPTASIWDSPDDIVRAGNGGWVGLAEKY